VNKEEKQKEWKAFIRGTHADQVAYREYVLAELRLARRRARLLINEIDVIGLALSNGIVDADAAVEWLHEARGLEFLMPTPPAEEITDAVHERAEVEGGRAGGGDAPQCVSEVDQGAAHDAG